MTTKAWADSLMEKMIKKLEKTASEIGATFPHISKDGKFDNESIRWWTNGFWPGILWLGYEYSGNDTFKSIAASCEEQLDKNLFDYYGVDHDAGFIWSLSAVAQYKILNTPESRRRALNAANLLAGRFNLAGNFIRAWNGDDHLGWAIVDCSMNLPLLYWASCETKDPRFRHIAKAHAGTVVRHFIRDDGSVNHIVSFDPETGERIEVLGGQGAAPDSAWARGNAWAIYGMALSSKYTGDATYLNAAKRAAHFFIANLNDDYVCNWDLRVDRTPETPLDTSAAACAACGLLEIASQVPDAEKSLYFNTAIKILHSLEENYSNFDNDNEQAFLRGGTVNKPANYGINVGIIYGDYFFMEAASRLCGNDRLYW